MFLLPYFHHEVTFHAEIIRSWHALYTIIQVPAKRREYNILQLIICSLLAPLYETGIQLHRYCARTMVTLILM